MVRPPMFPQKESRAYHPKEDNTSGTKLTEWIDHVLHKLLPCETCEDRPDSRGTNLGRETSVEALLFLLVGGNRA